MLLIFLRYYQLAAEHNFAPAQNNIGNLYFYGNGVEKDVNEAFKYYKLSADQGKIHLFLLLHLRLWSSFFSSLFRLLFGTI